MSPNSLRKSPGAGMMEAAGIEPASGSSRNGSISSRFRFSLTIAGIEFELAQEGKFLNLNLYDENQAWRFVEVDDDLIARLSLLHEVVKIAKEAHER